MSPLASISQTSVFWPRSAASRARAAAMVVLPTPPLPLTNSSLRSRRAVIGPGLRGAETDPAVLAGSPDLDVSDLGRGQAHLAAPAVGEPEHTLGAPQRLVDALGQLVRSASSASSTSRSEEHT